MSSVQFDTVSGAQSFSAPALQAGSAQASVDAAIGRIDAIQASITGIAEAIAVIQEAIATLQAELASLQAPNPSEFYSTRQRTEGQPPNQRTVTERVFDSSRFNAAMSAYLGKVQRLQDAICAKQQQLAQKEQELATKQQELAQAQQELAQAQRALEQALKNDARALEEAQRRYAQQQQRAQEMQQQVLQAQAQAQKAQEELEKAREQMQKMRESGERAVGCDDPQTLSAYYAATVSARQQARADLQNAANHLPQMRDGELLPPVSQLSARDFLELTPEIASFQNGVQASTSGLLVSYVEGEGATSLTPAVATQMVSAWQAAGFSEEQIAAALAQVAQAAGVDNPFVTPEREAQITAWVQENTLDTPTVGHALLGEDPALGALSDAERELLLKQTTSTWLSPEGLANGGAFHLQELARAASSYPELALVLAPDLARLACATDPALTTEQKTQLAVASAMAASTSPEATTALLDAVGPTHMGDYVAAFALGDRSPMGNSSTPIDMRAAAAFWLLEQVGHNQPTAASSAFVTQMFANATDDAYSMSDVQFREAMAGALANHLHPTDAQARALEAQRLQGLLASESGKQLLTNDALPFEARLASLSVVLANPSIDAALLDQYHGNLGAVMAHVAMEEINRFPAGEVSPLARMPALSPQMAAQFPALAALGQPLDAITLSQNIPEPLSRAEAAAYLAAQADAVRNVGDTDLSRFTSGNGLAAAGFELIAGNPIERAGLDHYSEMTAAHLDAMAATILASSNPQEIAQNLVLGASQAAAFDASMPAFAQSVAMHANEVLGRLDATVAVGQAVVGFAAPIIGGLAGGPPGAALMSAITQSAFSAANQYRATGSVDLGRVGGVFLIESVTGMLSAGVAGRVMNATGSRLFASAVGGGIEGLSAVGANVVGDPTFQAKLQSGDPAAVNAALAQFGVSFVAGSVSTYLDGALGLPRADLPPGRLPRTSLVAPGEVPPGTVPETIFIGYFGPIQGKSVNAAEEAAKYLTTEIEAGRLEVPPGTKFELVPLERTQASVDNFIGLAQGVAADGQTPRVLMLGENAQWANANPLSVAWPGPTHVETTANVRPPPPQNPWLSELGAWRRPSSGQLTTSAPVDAMAEAGGARLSTNAGTDYCNFIYTQALSSDLPNSVFVHVNSGVLNMGSNAAMDGTSIGHMVEAWFKP